MFQANTTRKQSVDFTLKGELKLCLHYHVCRQSLRHSAVWIFNLPGWHKLHRHKCLCGLHYVSGSGLITFLSYWHKATQERSVQLRHCKLSCVDRALNSFMNPSGCSVYKSLSEAPSSLAVGHSPITPTDHQVPCCTTTRWWTPRLPLWVDVVTKPLWPKTPLYCWSFLFLVLFSSFSLNLLSLLSNCQPTTNFQSGSGSICSENTSVNIYSQEYSQQWAFLREKNYSSESSWKK